MGLFSSFSPPPPWDLGDGGGDAVPLTAGRLERGSSDFNLGIGVSFRRRILDLLAAATAASSGVNSGGGLSYCIPAVVGLSVDVFAFLFAGEVNEEP